MLSDLTMELWRSFEELSAYRQLVSDLMQQLLRATVPYWLRTRCRKDRCLSRLNAVRGIEECAIRARSDACDCSATSHDLLPCVSELDWTCRQDEALIFSLSGTIHGKAKTACL